MVSAFRVFSAAAAAFFPALFLEGCKKGAVQVTVTEKPKQPVRPPPKQHEVVEIKINESQKKPAAAPPKKQDVKEHHIVIKEEKTKPTQQQQVQKQVRTYEERQFQILTHEFVSHCSLI